MRYYGQLRQRSTGDGDWFHWLPPNRLKHYEYRRFWVELKDHYRISMDPFKKGFVVDGGSFGSNLQGTLAIQIEEIISLLNS